MKKSLKIWISIVIIGALIGIVCYFLQKNKTENEVVNGQENISNITIENEINNIENETSNEISENKEIDSSQAEKIKADAYIIIWKDTTLEPDIDLYAKGTGEDKKIYLGKQPLYYLINQKGEIYTYQESSYKKATTGERDPATISYINSISDSKLKELEQELEEFIKTNSKKSEGNEYLIGGIDKYNIKINNQENTVYGNVVTSVLNKYFK